MSDSLARRPCLLPHTHPSVTVRVLLALQTGFWGDRNLILDEFSPETPRPPCTLLVSPRPLPLQVQQGPILVVLPHLTMGKSLYLSAMKQACCQYLPARGANTELTEEGGTEGNHKARPLASL